MTPSGILAHVSIVFRGTQIYVDLFCSTTVSQWPDLRKNFDLRRTAVTLSFTPCPISPMRTLVMEASCSNRVGSRCLQ